ncbi:MAG: hypothetical protein JOY56_16170, partial [Solirubrobacterales bacterium]|nr:hypothetical protein [Solirubrobacterales bacterium]
GQERKGLVWTLVAAAIGAAGAIGAHQLAKAQPEPAAPPLATDSADAATAPASADASAAQTEEAGVTQ